MSVIFYLIVYFRTKKRITVNASIFLILIILIEAGFFIHEKIIQEENLSYLYKMNNILEEDYKLLIDIKKSINNSSKKKG